MNVIEMFGLKGKIAIITGGAVGLGAQISLGLAEAGANLVLGARQIERCREMCLQLEQNGVRAIAVTCDVSKESDCQYLVDSTVKEFGKLDILVNNAGIAYGADSLQYPMDQWQETLDINTTGAFQLSVLAARVMKEQGGGKIVNIASVAGMGGESPELMDAVAYSASKAAVIGLTRDLAVKWARYGIYVNAVCPGWFPTTMSRRSLDKCPEKFLAKIPLARFGGDDDLKGAIVFLASDASNFITGQYLVVDGGQTSQI